GQTDFSFYRKPSTHILYQPQNIHHIQIFQHHILHFSSLHLIHTHIKNPHHKIIQKFHSLRPTILFHPNLPLPLSQHKLQSQPTINPFIPKPHILKISHEQLFFITA
ncbi:carbohydrate kinase family protein, partial [Staphylococcus epidermidis]